MIWVIMNRFAFAFLIVFLCVGCRRAERPVVGVVPKGANHIFWQTVHAGAVKAAQEYGLDIEWNAPAIEIDAGRQIAIVDSMVTRHLAGVALAPVDRGALVAVVERAATAGIPVAIFDSDIDTDKRITFVATNNREGGRMAARFLGGLLLGEGDVAIVGFMPGSAATMERDEGFTEEMKKEHPGIRIVQTAFGMADRAKARAVTENILAAHPNLRGLFTDNESSSAGAAMALKARANTRVRTVAFDSSDQLISDLRDRVIDALVLQNPFLMGYESVKALGMKLRGETPRPHVDSGVYLVRREDMEKPEVVELLRPDIRRWLELDRN
jgi:ribose transport system substrate-binding protein